MKTAMSFLHTKQTKRHCGKDEGVQGVYAVTSFMELRDIDLTKLHT